MGLSEILLSSKVVVKLLEVVAKGIGIAYTPTAIKKKAIAEAKATKLLAHADGEARIIAAQADGVVKVIEAKTLLAVDQINEEGSAMLKRANQRNQYIEAGKQENLENIIVKSFGHLDPYANPDSDVDPYWASIYFDRASYITEDEAQEIWAKVLAEEVSSPGTFSLRTLKVLSEISSEEAQLFRKVCEFISGGFALLKFQNLKHFEEFGISFSDIVLLQETGLVASGDQLGFSARLKVNGGSPIEIGRDTYNSFHSYDDFMSISAFFLTQSGQELYKVTNIQFNKDYGRRIKEDLERQGWKFEEL